MEVPNKYCFTSNKFDNKTILTFVFWLIWLPEVYPIMAKFLLYSPLNLTQTPSCFHDFHRKLFTILPVLCASSLLKFWQIDGVESQVDKTEIKIASEALTQASSLYIV